MNYYRSRSSDNEKLGCCAILLVVMAVFYIILFNVLRPIVGELLPGASDTAVGVVTFIVVLIIAKLL